MRPYVDGLSRRSVDAVAVELPKGKAERAVPAFLAAAPPGPGVVAGGRSFGSRVASLAAAEGGYAGLVLFNYPLRGDAAERTRHWPRISCPVLLIAGERDPMAPIDQLRSLIPLLREAELMTYPGGHVPGGEHMDSALDRVAAFCQKITG
jgi:predicted alpha/beta-hydrolase family hydrolase